MTAGEPGPVRNEISGGTFYGPAIQADHVEASFHLPAPAPVALAQLPPAAARFTGRGQELAVLAGLLAPATETGGPVVVSAVAGLAGVGKTALAVAAGHAARSRGWYPGGVLFIDLHGYDDRPVQPAQALDALLRALGIPGEHIPPGTDQRAALYRSALAAIPGAVLVVADNASSEAQVRPLMPGGGPHRVLVTSRHTLAGLRARLLDITILDPGSATALLDTALRAARPDDDRITADPGAAGRIAEACGGLPLALAITAAILTADPGLTAAELAGELGAEQGRLARLAYDDGTGGSSVAAAFDLSCRRLDDATARLFRLLAVHPGPDASTASTAALAGLPPAEARARLAALARAHLIDVAPGTAGRWRMHDLVRLYARGLGDQHAADDGRDQAITRLLDWYLAMTRAADDHLRALPGTPVPAQFTGRDDALAWLDAERPAFTAAVALAASTGQDQAAMGLSLSLGEYLQWRRRFDDWITATADGLAAARHLGDRTGEAALLINFGAALHRVRRFDEAITACQDAAAIYRDTGDRHRQGMALGNLGAFLAGVRRFDEAITASQQAAAIYRDVGDRHREGKALGNLGLTLRQVRRFDEAITVCQDAAAIYRETGDRNGEGTALANLGSALQEVRRFDEAITACQQAAAIYRDTGDRHGEGDALTNLGSALQEVRRFDEAITACQQAAAIYRETGDRHGEGNALNNLGLALAKVGQLSEAITAHQEAAAIYRETGDRHREGMALGNLGVALQEVRRSGEAIAAHQEAAAIYRETGDRHREGIVMSNLGVALRAASLGQEAAAAYRDAAAAFRETGDKDGEHDALQNLEQAQSDQTG